MKKVKTLLLGFIISGMVFGGLSCCSPETIARDVKSYKTKAWVGTGICAVSAIAGFYCWYKENDLAKSLNQILTGEERDNLEKTIKNYRTAKYISGGVALASGCYSGLQFYKAYYRAHTTCKCEPGGVPPEDFYTDFLSEIENILPSGEDGSWEPSRERFRGHDNEGNGLSVRIAKNSFERYEEIVDESRPNVRGVRTTYETKPGVFSIDVDICLGATFFECSVKPLRFVCSTHKRSDDGQGWVERDISSITDIVDELPSETNEDGLVDYGDFDWQGFSERLHGLAVENNIPHVWGGGTRSRWNRHN